MNYFKIDEFDSADGIGIRLGLYVSGCTHKCKGCHSSKYWPFDSGEKFTKETMEKMINILKDNDYIEGLSILGGDPLEPSNIHEVKHIIERLQYHYENWYGKKLNTWLWTGSIYENLKTLTEIEFKENEAKYYQDDLKFILDNIDVLVDGPFDEDKKDLNLAFRGSSNQRLIDMKSTRKSDTVVLLNIKENIHGN